MRTVVLLHTLPDGSSHFDWLWEQPVSSSTNLSAGVNSADDRVLVAFRVPCNPLENQEFRAERLPDHRRLYLDFEGPIAGNRGTVKRVGTGFVEKLAVGDTSCELHAQVQGSILSWTGTRQTGNHWTFQRQ